MFLNRGAVASYPVGTLLAFKSYLAVGSISAASNQLTLASNPGFAVNDVVIVETGGEAGAGARGTKGVGGTWPALSYATTVAMNADTSQAENKVAWVEATGDVYIWASSAWTSLASFGYYIAKANPKALVATVTAVNGLVLTLSTTATVAATNAYVHYDNKAVFNALGNSGSGATPKNKTLIIPTGSFALSGEINITSHSGWILCGSGQNLSEIFSPKGVPSVSLFVVSDGVVLRDFAMRGNVQNTGFFLNADESGAPGGDDYSPGIIFSSATGGNAFRIKTTDVWQDAVGTRSCVDVWATDCSCYITDGLQRYIQWFYLWADSEGGGGIRLAVNSPYLTGGISGFRSGGISFISCSCVNAVVEMNSCGNFLFDKLDISIFANTQLSDLSFSTQNPIVNISPNIQPPHPDIGDGGLIRNFSIWQEGYVNANNDFLIPIVVNSANPNVTILGNYPNSLVPGQFNGLMEGPGWASPDDSDGPTGVSSTGLNTIVDGIRVKTGAAISPDVGNIYLTQAGIVRNCVADVIVGGTQSNNQTNAEYEA